MIVILSHVPPHPRLVSSQRPAFPIIALPASFAAHSPPQERDVVQSTRSDTVEAVSLFPPAVGPGTPLLHSDVPMDCHRTPALETGELTTLPFTLSSPELPDLQHILCKTLMPSKTHSRRPHLRPILMSPWMIANLPHVPPILVSS
jgi:hypothetical protein